MKHYTEKEINEIIRMSQNFIDGLHRSKEPDVAIDAFIKGLKSIGTVRRGENQVGRPKIEADERFETLYHEWKDGKWYAREVMAMLDMKPNTFYRRVKDYEQANKK